MSSGNDNYKEVNENNYTRYNDQSLEHLNTYSDKSYFELYSLLNRTNHETSASYSVNTTNTLNYEFGYSGLPFNSNPNQWNREANWQEAGNAFNEVYSGDFPPQCPSIIPGQIEMGTPQASDVTRTPPFFPCDPLTPYKLTPDDDQDHLHLVTQLTQNTCERTDDFAIRSSAPSEESQERERTFGYQPPLLNQWVISNPNSLHSGLLNDGECYPTRRTKMQHPWENMQEKWISSPLPSSMNSKQMEEGNLSVGPLNDPENGNVSLHPESLLSNSDTSTSDAKNINPSSPLDIIHSPLLHTRSKEGHSEQSSHEPIPSATLRSTSSDIFRDPFHVAHRDSFGVSPNRSEPLQNSFWKGSEIGQPGSFDDEGDTSWSDSLSSCSSFGSTNEDNASNDADLSIEETINSIQKPQLIPCEVSTSESLHTYLSEHEVGHINYLVKCYSDAIFSIGIPSPCIGYGKILSPISILNLHLFGVLQVYYLLFKCEDYRNLSSNDQLCLLERNMIPVLISLGFMFFDSDDKCWRIPLALINKTANLPECSLQKILPAKAVRNLIALCDASKELRVDKIISLLFVFIIIYSPVDKQIEKNKLMENLREKYVRILLQYLRWKFGSKNGSMLFPEILKILDALLKFNEEYNDYKLNLSEDEITMVTQYFKYTEQQTGSVLSKHRVQTKDMFSDEMSYASFHAKLSSLLLQLGGD